MKVLHPEELYRYNYSVHPINSLRQYWRMNKTFSCLHRPKEQNIFVFLDGCSAVYTDSLGREIKADATSLIYAPEGMEYTARFFDFESENASTVGINFRLFDEESLPIVLENEIKVYKNANFRDLVKKIDGADKGAVPCFAAMKSGLYDIISMLGNAENTLDEKYRIIHKGIECLESGNFDMPIEKIAEMCNVSESYFRKLFGEYAGISPMQYRMHTKISKAKDYLCHTPLNSSEIADLLHFKDTSFFCRYFKSATGMTPAQYRRSLK